MAGNAKTFVVQVRKRKKSLEAFVFSKTRSGQTREVQRNIEPRSDWKEKQKKNRREFSIENSFLWWNKNVLDLLNRKKKKTEINSDSLEDLRWRHRNGNLQLNWLNSSGDCRIRWRPQQQQQRMCRCARYQRPDCVCYFPSSCDGQRPSLPPSHHHGHKESSLVDLHLDRNR